MIVLRVRTVKNPTRRKLTLTLSPEDYDDLIQEWKSRKQSGEKVTLSSIVTERFKFAIKRKEK